MGDGDEHGEDESGSRTEQQHEEEGELTEEEGTDDGEGGGRTNAAEVNEGEEDDELEEGELRSDEDSDDGVPEIRGGLSPPGVPLAFPALSAASKTAAATQLYHHQPPHLQQSPLPSSTSSSSATLPPFRFQQSSMDGQQQKASQSLQVCRFFLKGFCLNGDACRFKHCRLDGAAMMRFPSSDSVRNFPTAMVFNRQIIPPPTGPPIPLLSTEFAPPPSLLLAGGN
uniref:C3H1-type domain-containing protein n=1 Tax=Globodera pallida TaxID=36090 RepID=A0A183CTN1_GLOPA